ncbi:MAG: hypothetical protein V2J10_05245 [Wenzhouxiangella sp.]|jgi:hypothetical protein|nr:hypothetical protein [Wenzhouxiangella sp.]
MRSALPNRWQSTGLILWRGGLAFSAAYGFYWGAWNMIRGFDWPWQLTSGTAIAIAGFGLILVSVVIERIEASRTEGNLLDD